LKYEGHFKVYYETYDNGKSTTCATVLLQYRLYRVRGRRIAKKFSGLGLCPYSCLFLPGRRSRYRHAATQCFTKDCLTDR